MKRLKEKLAAGDVDITDWIHVDRSSASGIIETIDFWLDVARTRTAKRMLASHTHAINLRNVHVAQESQLYVGKHVCAWI